MRYYILCTVVCTYSALTLTSDVTPSRQAQLDSDLMTTLMLRRAWQHAGLPLKASYNTVKSLLDGKANVNTQDTGGNAALHYAARFKDQSLLTLLFGYNPYIDIPNKKGHTPLLIAFHGKNEESAALLLQKGASSQLESYIVEKDNITFKTRATAG